MKFYVYVYRDPRPTKNQQPVYVGKGFGDRAWKHWKKGNKGNPVFGNWLHKIRSMGLEPIIEVAFQYKTEAEAFVKEVELIAFYGRKDLHTGPLHNLTSGGEGTIGAVRTEEWRDNISASLSTDEQVSRNAAASYERWANPEYREKTVEAIRTAVHDPEVAARREAAKAKFNKTPEFRATMKAATERMWGDDAYRQATVEAQTAAQNRPEVSAAKSVRITKQWEDPETRQKRVEGIKSSRTDALKAQISASCTALWDDQKRQEQSEKMKAVLADPDKKAQRAEALKARWADPVQRAALLAARKK